MLRIDTPQIFWKPFAALIIAGPNWTLVFRSSTSLPFRHIVFRPEGLNAGTFAQRFQIAFRKSGDRLSDLPIRFHHKQRWNVGDAEGVAGWVAVCRLVKQSGKRYAEALIEFLSSAGIVLRYADDLD